MKNFDKHLGSRRSHHNYVVISIAESTTAWGKTPVGSNLSSEERTRDTKLNKGVRAGGGSDVAQ